MAGLAAKKLLILSLNNKPRWQHLILTGRNAPAEVIEIADTVTEMAKVKHAFEARDSGRARH